MDKFSLPKICSVENCEKEARARGWCVNHWRKWKAYGDPLGSAPIKNTIEKFWSLLDKSGGPDTCWPWMGPRLASEYGTFGFMGHKWLVHRLSAHLSGMAIEGRVVCHSCDNPICGNPAHLWVGSQKDNMQDARNKNRLPTGDNHYFRKTPNKRPYGERNGQSTLTESDVVEMRRLHAAGVTQRTISAQFGICNQQVSRIINRLRWAHVP